MKFMIAVALLFGASVATLGWTVRHGEKAAAAKLADKSPAGPVLIELFTSEGCSSCPPADALLAKFDSERRVEGAEVIVLEEHVDYWDRLGWKDPYSSPQWTARQQQYAEVFHNDGIYTPQMVIDGSSELVGSRERQARQTIQMAAEHDKGEVHLEPVAVSPDRYKVRITVQMLPASPGAQVWLAVTETGLHSNVSAGENKGEDLHHAALVRSLQDVGAIKRSADQRFTGETVIRLNPEWKRQNVRFVAFVQDKKTLRILGAASAPLP